MGATYCCIATVQMTSTAAAFKILAFSVMVAGAAAEVCVLCNTCGGDYPTYVSHQIVSNWVIEYGPSCDGTMLFQEDDADVCCDLTASAGTNSTGDTKKNAAQASANGHAEALPDVRGINEDCGRSCKENREGSCRCSGRQECGQAAR